MFYSTLATLVHQAINDCLAYGRGAAHHCTNGVMLDICADWAENETDIEITIKENCIVRRTFTEHVPAEFRSGGPP